MKNTREYVIELDGDLYCFRGNGMQKIEDLGDIPGNKYYVSDMQEAIARTMTVEATAKYADVFVRKNLQESGEFDGAVSVVPHWKKKGRNRTDIFFTAFPSSLSNLYFGLDSKYDENILLFPLYAVLLGILRQVKSRGMVAVVFQHGRFADLIIGSRNNIVYANRCVAFDSSEENLFSLWENIKDEINTVENSKRIQVSRSFLATWIDSPDLSEWSRDPERELIMLDTEAVDFEDDVFEISFLKALKKIPMSASVSPPADKAFFFSSHLAPFLNVLFLFLALAVVAGSLFYSREAERLQSAMHQIEGQMNSIQTNMPITLDQERLEKAVGFVKDLSIYRSAPSYKTVINDVSAAVTADMEVAVFKLDYTKDEMTLNIFGRLGAPFKQAHKGYRDFLSHLKQKGYSVQESTFNTTINDSEFLVTFHKRL